MTGSHDDEISEEARLMAARVRARAAGVPSPGDLARLAMSASGTDMSPAEIRALAGDAIAQAQKVAFLLGQLAGLLDEPVREP